jgi:hypothetical protein
MFYVEYRFVVATLRKEYTNTQYKPCLLAYIVQGCRESFVQASLVRTENICRPERKDNPTADATAMC